MAYQAADSPYPAWAYEIAGRLGVSVQTAFLLVLALGGFLVYKLVKR